MQTVYSLSGRPTNSRIGWMSSITSCDKGVEVGDDIVSAILSPETEDKQHEYGK